MNLAVTQNYAAFKKELVKLLEAEASSYNELVFWSSGDGIDNSGKLKAILLEKFNLTWHEYEFAMLCQKNYLETEETAKGKLTEVWIDHRLEVDKLWEIVKGKGFSILENLKCLS